MVISKINSREQDDVDKKILDYINTNYNKEIYLDKVAQDFGFTSKYLSSYFKRKFNMKFNEYITQLRIEDAKTLLANTDESILSISQKVGYVSNVTFNIAFKKLTGVSPSAYREQVTKKKK